MSAVHHLGLVVRMFGLPSKKYLVVCVVVHNLVEVSIIVCVVCNLHHFASVKYSLVWVVVGVGCLNGCGINRSHKRHLFR